MNHRNGHPLRYTLAELQAMPTIEQGHFDNLKRVLQTTRYWLSRCGKADGLPYDNMVTVECLTDGVWTIIDQYEAR